MNITFAPTKNNECYETFVKNPTDRKAKRDFAKHFDVSIISAVIRRHSLLCKFETAADYNAVYGKSENRIEHKEGVRDNEPYILKTRVTGNWRKFFHCIITESDFLLTKDWKGQFEQIRNIYVIDVNNHNYKKI